MHTLLIPPLARNSGTHELRSRRAGGSGNTRPLTDARAVHAGANTQGQAEGRLQALTRQSSSQNICTETR
jgi:hypothetical protein